MKKMRRVLALLLVLVMAASLLACGTKKTDDKQDTTTKTESTDKKEDTKTDDAGEEETAGEWTWPLEETKELSVWLEWSNEFVEKPEDLKAIQQIEKNTNVHIRWVPVLGAEATEKFGLLMASGDYPDILRGAQNYYTGGLVQACSDGVIYDLTDYVPQYMPTYLGLVNSIEKLQKDVKTDDGRMVGIYTLASNFGEISGERVWDGLAVRRDWLEDLGMDLPVTIDDWYVMLKAFKENYNCEAPLQVGSQFGYDALHNFVAAYGILGEFYNDNGTVKYGPLEPGYKEWVELFRQWYAEGLIDPNFVTNNAFLVALPDYIATGRAGATAALWGNTAETYKINGYTTDEDFYLVGVTPPVLNEGDPKYIGFATSELVKETLCVTTNCEDLELAMRWLDYQYTEECMLLDSMGIEGESYYFDENGEAHLHQNIHDMVAAGDFPAVSNAISTYTLMTSDFGLYNWGMFDAHNEGTPSESAMEAYTPWTEGVSFDLMLPPCMTMTEDETIAYSNKYTAIQTLVSENTIKFITGTQSMDQYDAFVQSLYDYGIEECIGYKQAALDRYNAR